MVRKVPPETVALLRRRYAEAATLPVLKAESGITSLWTIYRCLDGHYDDGSGMPLPLSRIPRRRAGLRITHSPLRRKSLVARIWRNAEAQVEQIETRLAQSGLAPDVFERDARSLAILVRTLRELTALAESKKPDARKQSKPENDDTPPRDLDELRRELARRMQAFVEERTGGGVSGGPEE